MSAPVKDVNTLINDKTTAILKSITEVSFKKGIKILRDYYKKTEKYKLKLNELLETIKQSSPDLTNTKTNYTQVEYGSGTIKKQHEISTSLKKQLNKDKDLKESFEDFKIKIKGRPKTPEEEDKYYLNINNIKNDLILFLYYIITIEKRVLDRLSETKIFIKDVAIDIEKEQEETFNNLKSFFNYCGNVLVSGNKTIFEDGRIVTITNANTGNTIDQYKIKIGNVNVDVNLNLKDNLTVSLNKFTNINEFIKLLITFLHHFYYYLIKMEINDQRYISDKLYESPITTTTTQISIDKTKTNTTTTTYKTKVTRAHYLDELVKDINNLITILNKKSLSTDKFFKESKSLNIQTNKDEALRLFYKKYYFVIFTIMIENFEHELKHKKIQTYKTLQNNYEKQKLKNNRGFFKKVSNTFSFSKYKNIGVKLNSSYKMTPSFFNLKARSQKLFTKKYEELNDYFDKLQKSIKKYKELLNTPNQKKSLDFYEITKLLHKEIRKLKIIEYYLLPKTIRTQKTKLGLGKKELINTIDTLKFKIKAKTPKALVNQTDKPINLNNKTNIENLYKTISLKTFGVTDIKLKRKQKKTLKRLKTLKKMIEAQTLVNEIKREVKTYENNNKTKSQTIKASINTAFRDKEAEYKKLLPKLQKQKLNVVSGVSKVAVAPIAPVAPGVSVAPVAPVAPVASVASVASVVASKPGPSRPQTSPALKSVIVNNVFNAKEAEQLETARKEEIRVKAEAVALEKQQKNEAEQLETARKEALEAATLKQQQNEEEARKAQTQKNEEEARKAQEEAAARKAQEEAQIQKNEAAAAKIIVNKDAAAQKQKNEEAAKIITNKDADAVANKTLANAKAAAPKISQSYIPVDNINIDTISTTSVGNSNKPNAVIKTGTVNTLNQSTILTKNNSTNSKKKINNVSQLNKAPSTTLDTINSEQPINAITSTILTTTNNNKTTISNAAIETVANSATIETVANPATIETVANPATISKTGNTLNLSTTNLATISETGNPNSTVNVSGGSRKKTSSSSKNNSLSKKNKNKTKHKNNKSNTNKNKKTNKTRKARKSLNTRHTQKAQNTKKKLN